VINITEIASMNLYQSGSRRMHQPDGALRPPLTAILARMAPIPIGAIHNFWGGEPGRPMGDDRNIYAMAITLTILFIIMSVVVWSHLK
jgi:hypothetical protein